MLFFVHEARVHLYLSNPERGVIASVMKLNFQDRALHHFTSREGLLKQFEL